MKILIAGGGIGGLTAALCGLQFGQDVTVLEQSAELGEVGAGLQLSPNAMQVFKALGLADELAARGFRPDAIETRMGESALSLFRIPLGAAAEARWGAPYLHIHRADLIEVLRAALDARAPGAVRLGAEVAGYEQDGEQVSVRLRDGEAMTGDALIGADGIHSAIRTQMLGQETPRFTGNMAWRAVVPVDRLGNLAPAPTACAWMGRGKHAVTYRLRGGELANFVGVVERDDWTVESWSEPGSREQALADFAGWHPGITKLIEEADELFRWALYDRAPLQTWCEGRAVLLGDAAHPMLPFVAQGAAMAIEDAWAVMSALATSEDVDHALQAYQTARLPRTSKVQALSRANAKTFHQRSALGRLSTYGPMWLGGRLAPSVVRSRLDWIYGYDVTSAG